VLKSTQGMQSERAAAAPTPVSDSTGAQPADRGTACKRAEDVGFDCFAEGFQ